MSKKTKPRVYDKAGKQVKVADKSWYTLQASGEAEQRNIEILVTHDPTITSIGTALERATWSPSGPAHRWGKRLIFRTGKGRQQNCAERESPSDPKHARANHCTKVYRVSGCGVSPKAVVSGSSC